MVVIFCEFKSIGCVKLAFGTAFTIVFCAAWLLITRGQYSIDILSGVLFGHYFWIMCERISWILDFEWFRQPFHLRHPCFKRECGRCLSPINEWAFVGSEQSLCYEMEIKEKGAGKGYLSSDKMASELPIDAKKPSAEMNEVEDCDESKMIRTL